MRYVDEPYVLGVPERRLRDVTRELGWVILSVTHDEAAAHIEVRRKMSVFPRHTISLPKDTRRRHVVDAFRVRLRMMGT